VFLLAMLVMFVACVLRLGLIELQMIDFAINIASWNVRGLNDPDRRTTVLETISDTSCHIVFLQETKLANVDPFIAASIGGLRFQGFAY
jgi:hypothetical protein